MNHAFPRLFYFPGSGLGLGIVFSVLFFKRKWGPKQNATVTSCQPPQCVGFGPKKCIVEAMVSTLIEHRTPLQRAWVLMNRCNVNLGKKSTPNDIVNNAVQQRFYSTYVV